MLDPTSKKVIPDTSGYTPSAAPVKGEGLVPEIAPEGRGELMPIRDQITPSESSPTRQVRPPDAPELPIPSPKAINRAAAKKEAADKAKAPNPWMANPSHLSALFVVLFKIQDLASETRLTEAEVKMLIDKFAVQVGMENAELAKKIKDLSADKEMVRAVGSFINAGVAAYQLSGVVGAKAKAEAAKDAAVKDKIDDQKNNIDTANKAMGDIRKTPEATAAGIVNPPMANPDTDQQAIAKLKAHGVALGVPGAGDAVTAKATEYQKALDDRAKAETEINKLEHQGREEFRMALQHEGQMAQLKGDIIKGLVEGSIGVTTSLYTKEEAEKDKSKVINDALTQLLNKFGDSTGKAKDDLQSQHDKVLQLLVQMSSETMKAHQLGRG